MVCKMLLCIGSVLTDRICDASQTDTIAGLLKSDFLGPWRATDLKCWLPEWFFRAVDLSEPVFNVLWEKIVVNSLLRIVFLAHHFCNICHNWLNISMWFSTIKYYVYCYQVKWYKLVHKTFIESMLAMYKYIPNYKDSEVEKSWLPCYFVTVFGRIQWLYIV